METLADPTRYGDLDENDPKSMARMMKRMGEEMGEDFGDELDAAMEEGEQAEESTSSSMSDPERIAESAFFLTLYRLTLRLALLTLRSIPDPGKEETIDVCWFLPLPP